MHERYKIQIRMENAAVSKYEALRSGTADQSHHCLVQDVQCVDISKRCPMQNKAMYLKVMSKN